MRLENFVDIMGINVVQVIEKIQRPGYSPNQPLHHPDAYMNASWPANSINEVESRIEGPSAGIDEARNNAKSKTTDSRHCQCVDHRQICPEVASGGIDEARNNAKSKITDSRHCQGSDANFATPAHTKSSLEGGLTASSSSIWQKPNRLRLVPVKEFIRQPMNLYSDAERVVRRDKSSILRSEKDDAFFERENFFDELLNEILPLHVAFYDRFYCEAK